MIGRPLAKLSSTNCLVVGEQSSNSSMSASLSVSLIKQSRLLGLCSVVKLGDRVAGVLVLKKGSDIGSVLGTRVLPFSFDISFEKEALRNLGRNLGDLEMKELSDMSRLLLLLLALL